MADISFRLDPEIIIGTDTVNRAGAIAASQGGRALVVTEQVLYEKRSIERLVSVLENSGVEAIVFDEIPSQATADVAEAAAELARGARCTVIIGFGGLKTQSIARLAAMITDSRAQLFDLLDGKNPASNFLPYIAVPTTGRDPFLFSNSFIAVDPRDRSVKLIKAPQGLCVAAIIDGGLSESLSGKFASTTAFDGFCAAVEGYCSTKAHFLSDALLEHAITLYSKIMNSYVENQVFDLVGGSTNAGLLMAMGCAISAPGIGTALAYALNSRFPVAKSWCSTVVLPYVLERFVTARPEKMAKAAALMGEPVEGASVTDAANMAVDSIRRRMGLLKVPARLKEFDLSLDKLVPVAESARNLEFVAYSPRTISTEDAYDILKQAY
ncbi:iron-containing alcohol dehydrogenase [Breznakiella homolactica]|uniref:Iron-containing alcohol dehydrogenase n=1 Tax=Breznakiella homolactica TaxID=2798577 RepID=A0A7T7XPX6_9SPIR|nr:iron-containing alcohol dehydrogenase [Breznakiella homolactica]QQO10228.1 iron-containing alcohol dehydrogenase [Breznakiella homolactica]